MELPQAGFITLPQVCSLKTDQLTIETMVVKGSENISRKWREFKVEPFEVKEEEDEQMTKIAELQAQAKNTSQEIQEAREDWRMAGEKTKEELNELRRLSDHVDMAIGASLALIAIAVVVILVVLCKAWRTICY